MPSEPPWSSTQRLIVQARGFSSDEPLHSESWLVVAPLEVYDLRISLNRNHSKS